MGRIATPPVAGVDYPATLVEFDQWLSSEEACRDVLQRVRWPEGFQCPACGASAAWRTGRRQFRCSVCQRQTSATAGTIFEGTRKPLRTWFKAMWYVTSQKQGVNALGLHASSGRGAIKPLRHGFTSCGEPWFGPDGSAFRVVLRSMNPMLEESSAVSVGVKPSPSPRGHGGTSGRGRDRPNQNVPCAQRLGRQPAPVCARGGRTGIGGPH